MHDQDRVVLEKLGLEVGDRIRWRDILERIRRSVGCDDLPSICGTCRWLPLGYCREGLNRLQTTASSATSPDPTHPRKT